MKYIIDIPDEVEWGVITCRIEDGFYTRDFDNLEELNSDYINEHFGDLQDTAYQRGLEDGKKATFGLVADAFNADYQKGFEDGKAQSERGCEGCSFEGTEIYLRPCSACRNAYPNQWTAKQTDDKIEVGDEVADKDGDKTIITNIHGELFDGLCSDGSTMTDLFLDDNRKTGRHFDIDKLLKEMQND